MRPSDLCSLPLLALALTVATPVTALAECLPAAARPALRAELLRQLRASQSTPEQLYRHAQDRLGFGASPVRAGALPPASGDPLEALADRLLDELAVADQGQRGADALLAGITRVNPPADAIDLSPNPFHHANTDMTTAYSELQRFSRELADLRRRIDALPPGPERDRLQARYDGLRRAAQITRNDVRDSATARALAHALLGNNADAGALLAEFWLNHFNVDAEKSTWATVDYRKRVQRGMCGRFSDLLMTVAKHPAMALYLDNFRSKKGAINENYARELMELHTFGDDLYRYYQQADVVKVAQILSGWSIAFDEISTGTIRPSFHFYPAAHDNLRLTLFAGAPRGVPLTVEAIAGDAGVRRGEQLLRYLGDHAATRRNVCTKLSRKLLGDAPAVVIDGCVADAVWGTGGDLGAIYRYFLVRPELWQASVADDGRVGGRRYITKQKTPLELVASAFRAVSLPNTALDHRWFLNQFIAMRGLGLLPARVPPPTGYSEGNTWTSSGLMLTWNQYLFRWMTTDGLTYRNGTQTLRGAPLEAHFAGRVTAANGNVPQLRELGTTVAAQVAKYPALAQARDSIYPALTDADTLRADGTAAPVRSYVHALLAHPTFLRK